VVLQAGEMVWSCGVCAYWGRERGARGRVGGSGGTRKVLFTQKGCGRVRGGQCVVNCHILRASARKGDTCECMGWYMRQGAWGHKRGARSSKRRLK
jgi:hypothetical protein